MKVYLAARYSRREELCGYRKELEAMGHTVTSRWLNGSHQIDTTGQPIGDAGEALVEGDSGSDSPEAVGMRQSFADEDMQDVLDCDCIVNFTEPPRSKASRGGRHVEFGIVLGINLARGRAVRRIIVVGQRENLFHWIAPVEFVPDWQATKGLLV